MKTRTFPFFRFLSCVVMAATIAGCATTQPIPYASRGLQLAETFPEEKFMGRCVSTGDPQKSLEKPLAKPKYDRQLTIRMNEEILKLVVTVKPLNIPGAMSLAFYVGESVKSNLENTLRPLFRSVNVSTSSLKEVTNKETVLDVDLKSYDFNIASSIFGTHTTKLTIQYSLYEEGGKNIFTILTNASGMGGETSHICMTMEDLGRFYILRYPSTFAPYIHRIGNSYDVAMARSIEELLAKLSEAWAPPRQ